VNSPDGTSRITEATRASMAGAASPRLREIGDALVRHLHAFVTEVRPTQAEWAGAVAFLTRTGQTCTPSRQEFVLLSDVLGVSMLVDELNHGGLGEATESTVLGPFYRDDPPRFPLGADISAGAPGAPLLVDCTVSATDGAPLAGVTVDTWQADEDGFYDVQKGAEQALRARFTTDDTGRFWFRTVVPADYPIPDDGPVGDLLTAFGRHPWRPAHVHFRLAAEGHHELITHLFLPGSPYLESDAVFGVKEELIQPVEQTDDGPILRYGFTLARLT
jgi:hydroxyquinol 1,2-dioxygenase